MVLVDPVEFLVSRRSVRAFEDREVPLDLVLKVLDVARWAPSAKNRQPWEFVIVRDRRLLDELGSLSPAASPLLRAPVAVAVVVDPSRAPLTHLVDGAVASTYILLAAHALGLGAVWINALRYQDEVRELLGIPEGLVPVSIVALGWPAERPLPSPRRSLEELVHLDRYGSRLAREDKA